MSIASRISSVAILSMFIGFPVSIPLGAVSLAEASVSGMATVLTKKYQTCKSHEIGRQDDISISCV